ncbi:hypothetical protein KM759_gp071 [Lymphocystis disease virus 4]|uniref:Uncharacterized protein n=1 Tax=Lymphocystis disease virus 4 TaxID=2704413 RepID=A0A6B9XK16_9VIRU|nr:hypothetical protein KM759_gp071 [Lymphocystis disease virus 4]QHR78575.1 hypothetical protein [Lymphocystis disease virus 4]
MILWKLSQYLDVVLTLLIYLLIFILIPIYDVKQLVNFILILFK